MALKRGEHDAVIYEACPHCEAELDEQQSLAGHIRHDCPVDASDLWEREYS